MNQDQKRGPGGVLVVGNNTITVVGIHGRKVRLQIDGPDNVQLNGQTVPATEPRQPAPGT